MANKANIAALEEQFKIDCEVVETKYEYPHYTGTEKWIIITSMTEEELYSRYAEQIAHLRPFIVLPSAFREVRDDYRRNEKKHYMRAVRSYSMYDFSEDTEVHHPEIICGSLEDDLLRKENNRLLWLAINQLRPLQRERLIQYFFRGKNLRQIAKEEGRAYSSVYESFQASISKLKIMLEDPDNLTCLSGNK